MDAALNYTVADLARDEMVGLRRECRTRMLSRAELAKRVGLGARLPGIGLRRELWCGDCGEPAFEGTVLSTTMPASGALAPQSRR
ncbi:hypothetical protein [Falsiroseomonas sp. HW251]|uniref:hypothetical protein n=1 Tax=Falsiroseomonas sp. HW251 TaxID=3390998 RepID=UPI003D31819B